MDPNRLSSLSSLPELFFTRCREKSAAPFLFKQTDEGVTRHTWEEAAEKVFAVASALLGLGFGPGERAAIMAENGPEFAFCDLAVQALGGVVVPIYTTSSEEEVRHILDDSDSRLLFLGRGAPRKTILEKTPRSLGPVELVSMADDPGLHALRDWLGRSVAVEDRRAVEKRIAAVKRDDLSSIIYTSGTTGTSKGVMLTHGNILSNVEASLRAVPLGEEDVFLSFLPMSHSFERSMGHYAVIAAGAFIHYARSLATVVQDFEQAAPTVAMVVPRFLEKMEKRVRQALKKAPWPQGRIASASLALRKREVGILRSGGRPPLLLRAASRAGSTLTLGKIRAKLGSRLRFLVSGGAALNPELWEFFEALGIRVIQGYGLTENAPVISVNPLKKNRPESVGLPIDNVAIRTAPDGEIEVSGPAVMRGYWKMPDETAQAITPDGWLRTGDVGRLDEAGYLYITDRKKDLIVTSSGKNISPQKIENALCMDPLVEFACVLGEGKNRLGALISPDPDAVGAAGARDPAWHDRFRHVVARVNQSLSSHERIGRFRLVETPFSRENGALTPTLKIRRRQIHHLYAREIADLFSTD